MTLGRLTSTPAVPNVASVPQLSPFRYPGGKTWFVPYVLRWLERLPNRPSTFVEAFAGGASVSCAVLSHNLADSVHLIELDEDVAAVWQTVFSPHAELLARRILEYPLEHRNVLETLARPPSSTLERAFQTVLRNRVQRGGILAPGAGLIREGENGKGLSSRWYPETLARRIRTLTQWRDQVTVTSGDALPYLETSLEREDCTYFLDPPYTAGGRRVGSRLYRHNDVNHAHLFCLAARLKGPFLMTYDPTPEVHGFVAKFALIAEELAMKNTHHAVKKELVIGRSGAM